MTILWNIMHAIIATELILLLTHIICEIIKDYTND